MPRLRLIVRTGRLQQAHALLLGREVATLASAPRESRSFLDVGCLGLRDLRADAFAADFMWESGRQLYVGDGARPRLRSLPL